MEPTLTVERTKQELRKRFDGLIDLSDLRTSANDDEKQAAFFTRALAGLAVMALSEADAHAAAASITDGYNDLGLDAIYFEPADDALYVVQAKWNDAGRKTIELGECNNFLEGMDSLVKPDFSKANERLRKREQEIRDILLRSDVRITLVVAHTGTNSLGDHVSGALEKYLTRQNNVGETEVFTLEVFDLSRVYKNLDPTAGRKINLQLGLSEWGFNHEPYHAYYGQMKLSDVADWAVHGKALFDRNLRFYRGATEVNREMENTISGAPEKFWYFNNGITVLCDAIKKAPLNGDARNWGVFHCDGVSVVNGAQTVGVVWERARQNATFFATSNARVQVRIISLENCPQGFGAEVTRATNTQNEIKHRDFAALDETQHRIAREMALDGRRYAFKSGDSDPEGNEGCTIEEATVALACAANDVSMVALAKSYVDGLWKDTTKPPYTRIFNERTRASDLWRAVIVFRKANETITLLRSVPQEQRGDQILVHGNRFILHVVFQDPALRRWRDPSLPHDELAALAGAATERAFLKVRDAVNQKHPEAYLQPLFKNGERCKLLFVEEAPVIEFDLLSWKGSDGSRD